MSRPTHISHLFRNSNARKPVLPISYLSDNQAEAATGFHSYFEKGGLPGTPRNGAR
jgi:hypothetical protein